MSPHTSTAGACAAACVLTGRPPTCTQPEPMTSSRAAWLVTVPALVTTLTLTWPAWLSCAAGMAQTGFVPVWTMRPSSIQS